MSLLVALKKRLAPELVTQIEDAIGDDFDWDLVPRSRLNAVVAQRNELRDQANKGPKNDILGDDGDDPDGLLGGKKGSPAPATTPETVQALIDAAVKAERKIHEAQIGEINLRSAVLSKLREAGAIDAELIYDSPKFARKTLKFNDAQELEGMDEIVKGWQTSHPTLFGDAVPAGTGKDGGGAGAAGAAKDSVLDAQLNGIFGF